MKALKEGWYRYKHSSTLVYIIPSTITIKVVHIMASLRGNKCRYFMQTILAKDCIELSEKARAYLALKLVSRKAVI